MVLNDIETDSPIRIQPARRMSDEEYYRFCAANPDFRIERTAKGEIVIMPPTGGETSHRNAGLTAQLYTWARREGRGKDFDSNVEYILPSGAARSPDASWVLRFAAGHADAGAKEEIPAAVSGFRGGTAFTDRPAGASAGQDAGMDRQRRKVGLVEPKNGS